MILPTLLALAHGDDTGIQLLYLWAAVLLALTPLLIFGTIGAWVARMIWKARREDTPHKIGIHELEALREASSRALRLLQARHRLASAVRRSPGELEDRVRRDN